jgi:hypothetical protein
VTLNGNPKLVVTVAYAPTEMADTDDKDEFYKTLRNHTSDNVKRHDVHLVIGDFNARLGKDSHEEAPRVVGPHLLHDVTNNNGERLLSYCLESNLRHAQSRFPHPKSRLWTWTHPAGSHAQLDHILISSKWTNSLRNCRAYNSVELDSDHRILSATIKVSLRTTKGKPCNRKKFNWKRLADPQVKQEFQLKLANRFAALQDDEPITARYDQFESTTSSIAEEVVGKRAPTGLPNWVSSKTEDLRKARDDAKRKNLARKTAVSRKRLKDLNLKLNASYQADQVKHLEDQLDTLTAADEKGETNKTWSIIHELSGKRRQSSVKVKKRDGNDPNSQQELLSEWKEYFKALLNNKSDIDAARPPPAVADLPINTAPPTLEETKKAIKSLKRNKAAALDSGITPEALKDGGEAMAIVVHDFCYEVYTKKIPPKQWVTNLIVPTPKKGDLSQMNNYRGITLMSICAKVYNKILLNRIQSAVDPKLRRNQAGFRRGRSCTQQIHVLRRIIEGFRAKQLPLVATFIDFRKAFDSIDREAMFAILRHYGIPEDIVSAIRVLYDNSKSAVLVDGQMSEEFEVTTGVLQGDVLAPFLFIIVLDFVMCQSTSNNANDGLLTHPKRSSRHPAKHLNDLDFADDISLLESSISRAQAQLTHTVEAAASVGLLINTSKTEYMALNCPGNDKLSAGSDLLKQVNDFRYLGSMVASSLSDFKRRKALAWSAFWSLEKIWRSQSVPLDLKLGIFRTTCLSILLYGSETWVFNKDMAAKLNAFATSCYRIMLGIRRLDKVSNDRIYALTGSTQLMQTVISRQLKFLGHILRMDKEEPANTYALYEPPHGKRPPGRQRRSFSRQVQEWIDPNNNFSEDDITRTAQDRAGWRRLAVACATADR